jgi:hypothetical protein
LEKFWQFQISLYICPHICHSCAKISSFSVISWSFRLRFEQEGPKLIVLSFSFIYSFIGVDLETLTRLLSLASHKSPSYFRLAPTN